MTEDEQDRLLREKLEVLILARLSVGARPASRAQVSKSLHTLLQRRFSAAEWRVHYEQAMAGLCEARLVEPQTLALTRAGRARLTSALGSRSLPRVASWKEFAANYLPRLFFPEFFAGRSRPPLDPRAALLAERLGVVPIPGARRDREAVIEAWLARELAIEGPLNLETVAAALLGRELGLRPGQTRAAILRQSVLVLAGTTKDSSGALSAALTGRWLFGERASRPAANGSGAGGRGDIDARTDAEARRARARAPTTPRALDGAFLARAAAKIERAARGPRVRSFGPNKVFIASVWESLAADPELMGLGEGGFKALLVEAQRRGLLALSRADLVAAMDPCDVAASETRHQNATYHFIVRGASA